MTETDAPSTTPHCAGHAGPEVAYCVIELRHSDAHAGPDFRFLEVNSAFDRHTGLKDVVGKWMRDLVPDNEQYWFDRYAEIARTGQPAHFEYQAKALGGRYFDIYAYPVGDAARSQVAILFSDITARKQDEALRVALFHLADRLIECEDTASLTDVASRILGVTLQVELVGFGTVDPEAETLTVERDWTTGGAASLAGTVRFRDFGSYIEDFKRGDTVVVRDARTDERTRRFSAALEARSARAFVNVPVFERGSFVALQYVSTIHPRDWTDSELQFIRDVAVRTRAAAARLQAEQALRELAVTLDRQVQARTRELDRAWRLSRELLMIALPDGTIDSVNPMWTELLGYEAHEIVGQKVSRYMHPDDLQADVDAFFSMFERPLTRPFEYRFRHKDGSHRWFTWTGALEDGKVYATGRDLTPERLREKALTDAKDFTQLALNAVGGVGIWTCDLQRQEYVGDAAIADLYGIDPVRLAQGMPKPEFLANVVPDDMRMLQGEIDRTLTLDGDKAIEYRLRHADGTMRWVLSRWRNYLDESGKPIRRIGVGIEVTSQRNIEEQLRQSQKMEAVGQLTGGLAHDFNNLLAGISGSLDLIRMRVAQQRFGDLERYMSIAQGATRRASALTHRLLAFSRRQTLAPKATDINQLVLGMEELVRRTIGPQIALEFAGAAGLWTTLVDQGQLENALLNLCINARDAMPDGGRITIRTANRWLDRRTAAEYQISEGAYLSLCVTDTGTGMSPEVVARVFEPFFTTKPTGEGTGLGLSMVHGFARQSGGQVRICSAPGRGTTVSLYLPRRDGAIGEDDTHREALSMDRSGQGETVLVVDDEPSVRMLVTDVLEDLGYKSIEAADSVAGLKALQSSARIDLLVTDVGLPGGMNGRQLADAGRESRPGLPVLFITGYAENSLIGHGHLKPGMQVLTKPFAVDTLALRIGEILGNRLQGGQR